MTSTPPALADLDYIAYLDESGQLTPGWEGKVGVYAIFNQEKTLQFIGYSRDVALSLRQHLVRQPQQCYWVKVNTIDRPSRTVLEEIRDRWIAENGAIPVGNAEQEALWSQPIDAKQSMNRDEQQIYAAGDELAQIKLLKQVARRVEEQVLAALAERGVQMQIRFNPKLKESGLLDLK
ncbi:GIY-YIG nuclease family protein [Oscillatoria sp. FACHB-1407]|uniref:GIY-YIG nuclease family protein n=1 Tax=Oscillatoria sp. FACHB-1407 TaxID=2692847 RepID=UPI001685CB7B|nr:GIY-YIG nuclease family protein [Oscillatoria sp. FACHB-1407]MBD2461030.1 GIY-YIG nuclease family protein [Oscillatoria sp. FACHB-1407]